MKSKHSRTASGSALLTREEFKGQVFARSGGKCVFCDKDAVDPHHIVERKLFSDGGFYLSNGAAVCEGHHWQCETTELSLATIRAAAGIDVVSAAVPPWFLASASYDKWGNRIWPSGLRSWGPLEHDTGARRALALGGYLAVMMPSTYQEPT